MTLPELMLDTRYLVGSKIRRRSWVEHQYLHVYETRGYGGTDFGYDPDYEGPLGLLTLGQGRRPWWIAGTNPGNDWEFYDE